MKEALDPHEQLEASERHLQYMDEREKRAMEEGGTVPRDHETRFRCFGCGGMLGTGPADGIGEKLYHPACAERARLSKEK